MLFEFVKKKLLLECMKKILPGHNGRDKIDGFWFEFSSSFFVAALLTTELFRSHKHFKMTKKNQKNLEVWSNKNYFKVSSETTHFRENIFR
jgi:spore cortex formation protein SpoVR/YcgB (stage V sporulation)